MSSSHESGSETVKKLCENPVLHECLNQLLSEAYSTRDDVSQHMQFGKQG